LRVNDTVNICLALAKCRKDEGPPLKWSVHRRVHQPMGWTVAIRLDENNKAILDYVLFHFPYVGGRVLRFYEQRHPIHKMERFEAFEELTRSLVRRVNGAARSTQANRQQVKAIVSGAGHGRWSRARQQ